MGAIRNNSSRPNRTSQQTRTEDAAKAARQKGLLHPGDVQRMTDGRVSFQDVGQAKRMVANAQWAGDGDELKVAKELASAITSQIGSQGLLPTMMETSRDERAQIKEMVDSVKERFEAHRKPADAYELTPEQQQMKDALRSLTDRMHEQAQAGAQGSSETSNASPRWRDPGMSPFTPFLGPEVETF